MRYLLFCAVLAAACNSTKPAPDEPAEGKTGPKPTRIVLNTYRGGVAGVFIMENLAGRDLKELRSKPIPAGRAPVAYVEDDVMDELLKVFRKKGFDDLAQARPSNPMKFGATSELTLVAGGRMRTLLKKSLNENSTREEVKAMRAFVDCKNNFIAVYNTYRPQLQATRGDGGFGVKRPQ